MRRWTCAAVARAAGHHFRPGAPVRGFLAPAYTAQEQSGLDDSELDEDEPDAVYHTEELQQALAHDDKPDAVYLADEMTPSLARLVAGTTMAKPQTRNMRTNLELLRRHNSSGSVFRLCKQPGVYSLVGGKKKSKNLLPSRLLDLDGRVIRVEIIRLDRRYAYLDTGFKSNLRFIKKNLKPSQLVREAPGDEPRKFGEYRAGDILEFRIHSIESPFGDMQLSNDVLPAGGDRFEDMWEELEEMKAQRKQVMGRMLNTITGGYAVGIGGIVAFLPFSSCSLVSAGRIGALQAFYITSLNRDKKNVVLVDARIAESANYRGRAGDPDFRRGSPFSSLY